MTRDEFDARRAEIYRQMVRDAHAEITARGTCSRGRIMATAKGIAMKRFLALEGSVYA